MSDKLRISRRAAAVFFETANPDDEFFLVEFNDEPRLAVPLTREYREVQKKLDAAMSARRALPMFQESVSTKSNTEAIEAQKKVVADVTEQVKKLMPPAGAPPAQ